MKILGVIAHVGRGGGQVTQTMRLLKELGKRHKVTLLTLKYDSDLVKPPVETVYAGAFRWPGGMFDLCRQIRRMGKDYDVVQCFDGYYSFPAAFLARKKPYFLRFGMDSRSFLEQKGVPFPGLFGRIQMMPCAIKDCAGFVVNSNTLKAVCDEYSPTVIRNGYDVDEFAVPKASKKSLRKRLGLPQGKTLMLFTGKIVAWKNLELVFELLKESRDLFLVVLGEAADRSYCNMLKSKYSSLAGQFAFHPEVNMDEVRLYLHACDIFVFPSIKEGSPNSVLEAMAAGMPVVCSSIPAHREIIQSAHNGFTFGNIRELRRIVNRLAHDTELRNQVGGAAKEYAKSNHNIATIADQYVRLYSSKLDGKKVATC